MKYGKKLLEMRKGRIRNEFTINIRRMTRKREEYSQKKEL